MVGEPGGHVRNRSGKSRLGTLVGLLILAAALYYGVPLGGVYIQRWRMVQEIKSVARLAPSLDDATIRRRLHAKAEELDLPLSAHKFTIRRLSRPREIRIGTSWEQPVDLPFVRYIFKFRPEVRYSL